MLIATLACMAFFVSIGCYGYKKKKTGLAVFGGAMALTPPVYMFDGIHN